MLEEGKLLAKKAMEIDPRDPVAYFVIGRNLMLLGEHDDAIAALKYSLELNFFRAGSAQLLVVVRLIFDSWVLFNCAHLCSIFSDTFPETE